MLRAKKCGDVMANHALLMSSHTPNIPNVKDIEPRWYTDSVPRAFIGVGYTDGSASTNHAFKKARRAGWAALVIAEELPIHSDVQGDETTSQDNGDSTEGEAVNAPRPSQPQFQREKVRYVHP